MPQQEPSTPRPRTFYGDPFESIEELMSYQTSDISEPPQDGDELCDGHLMHYIWKDGKWT
jgi:hypothetical protein